MEDNSQKKVEENPAAVNGKVLLLEDDPGFLEFYRGRLRRFGFEVFTEDDEDEGLDLALSCLADVIILDISLPKDDDFEFLNELKKYPQLAATPVVILTDLNDEDNRRKGLSYGAKEYFVRDDISFLEVMEKIRQIIEELKVASVKNKK